MSSKTNKRKNKSFAKKVALKWDGRSEVTKDSMKASRRNYGIGLAK